MKGVIEDDAATIEPGVPTVVRDARPDDGADILTVLTESFRDDPAMQLLVGSDGHARPRLDRLKAASRREWERMNVIVAERDGRIVGALTYAGSPACHQLTGRDGGLNRAPGSLLCHHRRPRRRTRAGPMTTPSTPRSGSWLDTAFESEWAGQPWFDLTVELLRSVRDHDFDTLAARCDDDFGIVDLDPAGGNVMVRTREEWEAWFRRLFAQLDAMSAATDSRVTSYQVLEGLDLGYSVVEFTQTLTIGEAVASFDCVVTIIWKRTSDGWKESRWHISLLSADIPEGMRP